MVFRHDGLPALDPGGAKSYTTPMHMLIGIVALAVAVLCLLGWLAPLVIGIRLSSLRRGGTALIVVGGVWGAVAVSLLAMGAMLVFGFRGMSSQSDPKAFDAAAHAGPKGLIRTAGTGATSLTVLDESGSALRLESTNGILAAPAGTLRLTQYAMTGSLPDGRGWTVSRYGFSDGTERIAVPPGGTAEVALGPPYRAVVTTSKADDGRQTFDLQISSADGNRVSLRFHGARQASPQFEVLDAGGRSVWSGNFEYG